ncbi:MAG: drug/metabolite transporter (DMT)-like permease [Paracoccaceae bacterium]|jgi:drug/metabolite transporter (DMT)-like permease
MTDRLSDADADAAATAWQLDGRPLRAAAWMSGAMLCFSSMAVAGREVARLGISPPELMMWRSFIGVAIIVAILGARGSLSTVRVRRTPMHLIRNAAHFTGQNLWFFAVATIPLAQLFAFEFTSPIWVAILAPLVLRERFTRTRVLSATLGFIGILIVARPGTAPLGLEHAAAALCAIAFAFNVMTTKMLSRTESTASILLMMTVTQSVFGIVATYFYSGITLPDLSSVPLIVVVALAGLTAHFCLTSALGCAPATVVAPMEFLRLPLIAVVGVMVYGEPLEIAVFAGGAVVLAANLLNIRAERRARALAG